MKFKLFISCLFLISQINLNDGKNIKRFVNLFNVQTKLNKIQTDIFSASAALEFGAENVNNLKWKIDAIEKDVKTLKEELAAENPLDDQTGNSLTILLHQQNTLNANLDILKSDVVNFSNLMHVNVANNKNDEKIEPTKQTFEEPSSSSEKPDILQDTDMSTLGTTVVNTIDTVVNTLHDFKAFVGDVRLLSEKYDTIYEWIGFAKDIQFTGDDSVKDSIKEFTTNALKNSTSFEKGGEVESLTAAVYLLDPSLSKSIIEDFVNDTYNVESAKSILQIIGSHKFIAQRVNGVSALFWKMKAAGNLNSNTTFDIASFVKNLRSDNEFENLNKIELDKVEQVIESLPICARNLFFAPSSTVRLYNKGRDNFLQVDYQLFDEKSRSISKSYFFSDASCFYANNIGEYFLFSNKRYKNEYLYTTNATQSDNSRFVLSRKYEYNNINKKCKWIIELDGDFCFIKSAWSNEYMFFEVRGSVFTKTKGQNRNSPYFPYFQWQIRASYDE